MARRRPRSESATQDEAGARLLAHGWRRRATRGAAGERGAVAQREMREKKAMETSKCTIVYCLRCQAYSELLPWSGPFLLVATLWFPHNEDVKLPHVFYIFSWILVS